MESNLRRVLNILTVGLTTVCLVNKNIIAFDPAITSQSFSFWTLITANLSSTSIFELATILLLVNFVLN